jgi:hypothetical protein
MNSTTKTRGDLRCSTSGTHRVTRVSIIPMAIHEGGKGDSGNEIRNVTVNQVIVVITQLSK